jgi:SAM-dependent methyltransferase
MGEATQAQIAAAQAYEGLFVPALFQQWASRIADAAQIRPDQHVLDVACGTGVLAREIAARLGERVHITGVDASPGMLAVAREIAPSVDWRQGAAEELPFPDRSFDIVVSQFGLMFFTDRSQALREMMRVLTSGGRLAIAVWDSLENNPAYASVANLVQQSAGQPAGDALRAPFVLGNTGDLATLFKDAGVVSPEIRTHRGTARFPSIRTMVEADLRGWLPMVGITLTEDQISRLLAEAERVLGCYVTADGRVAFQLSVHLITAQKS